MTDPRLQTLLEQLRDQLASSGTLDADTRRQLDALRAQIADLTSAEGLGNAEQGESVSTALQEYIDHFEKTHPSLTLTLGRIADALNKIGI